MVTMTKYPRYKGAPFNPRTIRWHRARGGMEWQYWNVKVARFCRHTRQPWPVERARQEMARWCYGCDPEQLTVEQGA
jgi:hypothetical protein